MAMFKKKKPGYIDLGKRLEKQEARLENFKSSNVGAEQSPPEEETTSSGNGFFGGFFGGSSTASEVQTTKTPTIEERREKLRNKIKSMSQKLDEQEKEIYNLKQRLEVLERKQRVGY